MMRMISYIMTGVMVLFSIVAIAITFLPGLDSLSNLLGVYFLLILVYIVYMLVAGVIALKNTSSTLRRRRILKFVICVSLSMLFVAIGSRLFGTEGQFGKAIFPAVGTAFGITMVDLVYKKKEI